METSTKEVKTTKPATPAASSSKKKRGKRTVTNGLLCIKATYNNTIVTVTDEAGNVLTSASMPLRSPLKKHSPLQLRRLI